jgi:hypothetical protein
MRRTCVVILAASRSPDTVKSFALLVHNRRFSGLIRISETHALGTYERLMIEMVFYDNGVFVASKGE